MATSPHPELQAALIGSLQAAHDRAGGTFAGTARRAELLEHWLVEVLARCEDLDFAQRMKRGCPVPGLSRSDYLHAVLRSPDEPALVAGIRFKGGDVSKPFVDLFAWDREPVGHEGWERVVERLTEHFRRFRPRAVRLRWLGSGSPPLPSERLELDQQWLAGKLQGLRTLPRPGGFEQLDVRRATDLSFYALLAESFAAWQGSAGARGQEVCLAAGEDLEACLDDGAVICLYREGRWAGVLAARRSQERALHGFCVHEFFLDAAARGRGLASLLQRHLIEALPGREDDCLFGTIHHSNAPSRAAALRCGREVVEGWWFVRLD